MSRAFGEGIEPGDIRQFAPGDRIRQVNWRASLRLGELYVTQQHRERNADVVLMLDTMAEVGTASETTLDAAVRAAASLATAYLARKDRVGLIVYGGVIDWVRPGSGRAQYERIADSLLRADVVFTYVTKDLKLVPPRVLPPHAFVVAITPLLDRRFTQAAVDLVGARLRRARPRRVSRRAHAGHWRLVHRSAPRVGYGPSSAGPGSTRCAATACPSSNGSGRAPRGRHRRARPPPASGHRRAMRQVPVPAFALLLGVLTFRVAPIEPVVVIGLAGMLLVIVGMVMPWRWPIVTAACLFTTNHALALWAMDAPVSIFGAACFGLAQLGLLQAADLRRCTRASHRRVLASCASRSLAASPSPH